MAHENRIWTFHCVQHQNDIPVQFLILFLPLEMAVVREHDFGER